MLAVIAASLRGRCPLAMGSRLHTDFPMEWWIRRESNPRHVWFSGPVPRPAPDPKLCRTPSPTGRRFALGGFVARSWSCKKPRVYFVFEPRAAIRTEVHAGRKAVLVDEAF